MTEHVEATDACTNTDREIWRERDGDLYADSIHVTEAGGIGIACGGYVIVKPVREWHRLALTTPTTVTKALESALAAMETMVKKAYEIGLEGQREWDEIGGSADIHGTIDECRAALAKGQGQGGPW